MYAVIVDRNRQYKASVGDRLVLDRNEEIQAGTLLDLPVMLLAETGSVKLGAPFVAGAKATVKVLEHTLGDKITVGKYKRRKHMTNRRKGFRHQHTVVEVTAISG